MKCHHDTSVSAVTALNESQGRIQTPKINFPGSLKKRFAFKSKLHQFFCLLSSFYSQILAFSYSKKNIKAIQMEKNMENLTW